jgi:hypothetical protein
MVPRMGFGPIRQRIATRVQAASVCHFQHRGTSTKVRNVGAVTGLNPSPAPTCFRPFSAAPNLFSWHSSCARKNQSGNRRNQFLCNGPRFRTACIRKPIFLTAPLSEGHYVAVFGQFVEDTIQSRSAVSASGSQTGKKFGSRYRVIISNHFLSVEHDQNCIVNGRRSNRQRDITPISAENLVEIKFRIVRLLRGLLTFRGSIRRYALFLQDRRGDGQLNQLLPSHKLFPYKFWRPFKVKFVLTNLGFESNRVHKPSQYFKELPNATNGRSKYA